MTQKYYTPNAINRKNATYNVIFGERSNGKTYALLKQSVEQYLKDTGRLDLSRLGFFFSLSLISIFYI